MKIINKTKWNADHLRAIAKRVAAESLEANERARLTVTFQPSRKWVHGKANVGTARYPKMRLHTIVWLPNKFTAEHPERRTVTVNKRYASPGASPLRASVAMMLAHEFAHNAGRRGERSMRGNHSRLLWASVHRGDWDWAEDMPLEQACKGKNTKPRPTDADKLSRIEENIRRRETKAKRASTYLKKYRRQQRYYQRKLAAQDGDQKRNG